MNDHEKNRINKLHHTLNTQILVRLCVRLWH